MVLAKLENAGDSFAWSPDGRRLVSGSGCQQVTVWNASTGAALKELSGGKCSESYSGIKVTWAAKDRIYGVSMGTKILAWDGNSYTLVEGFSAEGAKDTWVSAILTAPEGNLLVQYDNMGYPIMALKIPRCEPACRKKNRLKSFPAWAGSDAGEDIWRYSF